MSKALVFAKRTAIGLALCAGLAHAQAVGELGFTSTLSPALIAQYTRLFGASAPDRIAKWAAVARELKASDFAGKLESAKGREAGVLKTINETINRHIKWAEDKDHWASADYWATPAESIGSAGGDCEDFSIAKYYLLKELGIPIHRLRITYVRILNRGGSAHMVLAYYSKPDAEPLILDNMFGGVESGKERFDLDPVYSFNDDELSMSKSGQRGKPAQIRAWLALQERLAAESRL